MMNVREYFESLMENDEMTLNEVLDLEEELWGQYYEDDGRFETYMAEHNVDLTLRNKELNETYLTLWVWDMCGD